MWSKGIVIVGGENEEKVSIKYWCKHFDEPSVYGINEGRISKLMLEQNGVCVYNFDRGIDIEPKTDEAKDALETLMDKYN